MMYLHRLIEFVFKLINDILTGRDNKTFDSGRVWLAVTLIYYNYMAKAAQLSGHPWSATDYATGISIIAVAFSMNMRIKDTTEPDQFPRNFDRMPPP